MQQEQKNCEIVRDLKHCSTHSNIENSTSAAFEGLDVPLRSYVENGTFTHHSPLLSLASCDRNFFSYKIPAPDQKNYKISVNCTHISTTLDPIEFIEPHIKNNHLTLNCADCSKSTHRSESSVSHSKKRHDPADPDKADHKHESRSKMKHCSICLDCGYIGCDSAAISVNANETEKNTLSPSNVPPAVTGETKRRSSSGTNSKKHQKNVQTHMKTLYKTITRRDFSHLHMHYKKYKSHCLSLCLVTFRIYCHECACSHSLDSIPLLKRYLSSFCAGKNDEISNNNQNNNFADTATDTGGILTSIILNTQTNIKNESSGDSVNSPSDTTFLNQQQPQQQQSDNYSNFDLNLCDMLGTCFLMDVAHFKHSFPVGLNNRFNTCYLNSVLQCLYICLPFRKLLLNFAANRMNVYKLEPKEGSQQDINKYSELLEVVPVKTGLPAGLGECIYQLFVYMDGNVSKKACIYPQKFINTFLAKSEDFFPLGTQHDAHEFFLTVLNNIIDEEQKLVETTAGNLKYLYDEHIDSGNSSATDFCLIYNKLDQIKANDTVNGRSKLKDKDKEKKQRHSNGGGTGSNNKNGATPPPVKNAMPEDDSYRKFVMKHYKMPTCKLLACFEGDYEVYITCLQCKNMVCSKQRFMDLSISFSDSMLEEISKKMSRVRIKSSDSKSSVGGEKKSPHKSVKKARANSCEDIHALTKEGKQPGRYSVAVKVLVNRFRAQSELHIQPPEILNSQINVNVNVNENKKSNKSRRTRFISDYLHRGANFKSAADLFEEENMNKTKLAQVVETAESEDEEETKREVKTDVTTMEKALKKHFDVELMEGDNKFHCEKCSRQSKEKTKVLTDATVVYKVSSLPEVLTIHFKRFKRELMSNHTVKNSKINANITFPMRLSMRSYCTSDLKKKYSNGPNYYEYELVALVEHLGVTLDKGHYVSYIKKKIRDNNHQWYLMDDETCTAVTEDTVKKSSAYLLFYQRDH